MGQTTFSGPIRAGTVREGASANVGKVVLSQSGTIAYTNAATAVAIATLPANSQIIEIYVDVTTAFNSSGTDLLDLGDGTTANLYADNLDLSSVARLRATSDVSQIDDIANIGTTDKTVYATYSQSVADASTGAAKITVVYVQN